jgi:hypothetical protein
MRQPRFHCSFLIALAIALFIFAHTAPTAAESPPYQAKVIATGASVQSGPGDNFYPTDTLTQGDVVEVYKEKPGGWLAIRPPLNSFSWIPERELNLKDGGLAEVKQDDVASRIGSRLNASHNAAQVRLKKGEAVEVLGQEEIRGEKWCKIAPPAGEFRWIQASLVERVGPIPSASNAQDSNVVTTAASVPAADAKKDTTNTSPPTSASSASNPLPPPLMAGATQPQTPQTVTTTQPATTPVALAAQPNTQPPANTQPSAGPVAGDLSQELSAVELRLSRMVAAPTNLWNTERLERDTAQLMARAKTQSERDAVRVTQDKINRFAELARRHNQPTAGAGQLGAGSADPRTASQPGAPPLNSVAENATGGPYDAVGILRPVVSRRPGAPQFALVDERGQVVSFVTPTPDLNLQPYLGRRVGVVGNRGFIQEFQRSNVTAARVTPLNDRLVR